MMNYPIVLFAYKRPKITEIVLKKILKSKPKELYIFADGHKGKQDANDVKKTRTIIKSISMRNTITDIHIILRDRNYGLKRNIVNGIDHVLSKNNGAIILEDDCLPSADFFEYCNWALNEFEHDNDISTICGTRISITGEKSCIIKSKYFLPWGWALWKKTWDMYLKMNFINQSKILKCKDIPFALRLYLHEINKLVNKKQINTWDYKMIIMQLINKKFSIVPKHNLIKNIGYGKKSTNTIAGSVANKLQIYDSKSILAHNNDKIYYHKKYDDNVVRSVFLTPISIGGLFIRKYVPKLLKIAYR